MINPISLTFFIKSNTYYRSTYNLFTLGRCTDPMEEVVRMAELPELYAKVYDRPFQPPPKLAEELQCSKSAGMSDKVNIIIIIMYLYSISRNISIYYRTQSAI